MAQDQAIRIGLDVGGTFTDLVLHDGRGRATAFQKVLTTPEDLTKGIIAGLDQLLASAGITSDGVGRILHATTVATNAVLERRGSRTALITTRGFRDVLLIGRQKRYNTYDLYLDKPAPLARRRHIYEVDERVGFNGEVIRPIDAASIDRAIDDLLAAGCELVAVVLLHSYANPAHERAILERMRERAPQLSVSVSSDLSPRYREYERASTTVTNAYVRPLVRQYIDRLQQALEKRRFSAAFSIMQSNGGVTSVELARQYPVRIIESGPAAGVLMSAAVGVAEGLRHIITFDMGGTTAKLGAVDDGKPVITPTFEVDNRHFRRFSGLPLNVAAVELLEIGSGGGSIATTEMGLIRVGPISAGADPGPICYGRAGTCPTVTDANLVLGYLDPMFFNGGAITLDAEASRRGIAEHIAQPLKIDVPSAAWGIHAVVNSNMETAMRVISIERGRDPRQYGLVAFGGAGPIHACRLARSLGIRTVIVPHGAGVGSAIGLLTAEPRIDVSITRILTMVPDAYRPIEDIYQDLEGRAAAEMAHLAAPGDRVHWSRHAYFRHVGQGFEIRVDLPPGPIGEGYVADCLDAFFAAYEKQYGYRDNDSVVEAVDWQLVGEIGEERDALRLAGGRANGAAKTTTRGAKTAATRLAFFPEAGGFVDCAVIYRDDIAPGARIVGPAVIEEREATTVVLPGDVARVTDNGHLIIEIDAGARA